MAKIRDSGDRDYVVFPGDFIWLPIPKVATSSMRNAWGRKIPLSSSWAELDAESVDLDLKAFVRHPLDRMLSGFAQVFGRTEIPLIEEHVDKMLEMEPTDINRHVRPQWCFFKKSPAFLGHFETLHSDWAKLMQSDPKILPLPHKHASDHLRWEQLPKRLRDKATEVYRGDFSRFGYQE
jgi:hypothetical protein